MVSSEWKEYKLGEIYEFSSGLSKSRDEFGSGYEFLTFKDVFYNYFVPNKLTELVNSSEKERERCSIKRGDVFLTRTSETQDELGMSSVALKDYEGATFNGFTKRLRPKNNVEILPEYVGYYFRSPSFRKEVTSMSSMTTRASLNNDMMSILKLVVPTLDEQKKIAKILYDIDKKIESNNKINENLQTISQLLFKHWFVNFEFPNEEGLPYKSSGGEMVECELGMIPKAWEVTKISDLDIIVSDYVANGSFASLKENVTLYDTKEYALFMRNTDLKVDFTNSRKYADKHSYDFLEKSKLFGGEVIISNVGDVGSVYLCPKYKFPMTLGNNVIMLKTKDNVINHNLFLYNFFVSRIGQGIIDGITGGTAQPKFNKTDFRNSKLIFPSRNILANYNLIENSTQNMVFNNKLENEKLSELRDTLLTKLMNGEIDLSNLVINE